MAETIYALCALTSIGCAFMLLRNYFRSRSRLLLWSGLCFACWALSNIVMFIDLAMLPAVTDLSIPRSVLTLAGVVMLLYGLIWETT